MTQFETIEFLELLKAVEKPLSHYALSLCKDSDEAKDLVQDTVSVVYENFSKLRDKAAFKAYLFQVARRAYIKMNRKKRLFFRFDEAAAENIPDTSMRVGSSLDVEDLYQAMKELPFAQREAISLFEISGFSIKEVAEIQKTNENTVKTRLKRGRARLAILLEVESSNNFQINNNGALLKENAL